MALLTLIQGFYQIGVMRNYAKNLCI